MDSHLIDSQIYGHLWSTPTSHAVFSEQARMQRWVVILRSLAMAQAVHGLIPPEAATDIGNLVGLELPLDRIAHRTRETSHSTLGFIEVLRELLPEQSREFVYYGTTVQDLTDTSMALEVGEIAASILADLMHIEGILREMAKLHRDLAMSGRTHGQPGSPITFGFKVATWVDELGRQIDRLEGAAEDCRVGQLGGAVGTVGFFGSDALAIRADFCKGLGLEEPTISWLVTRDRLAHFGSTLSLTMSTLARIGNEVYNLQRGELGEVAEATSANTVGSITMPHKRNPESSEQIVTLARLVRAQAGVLVEGMVAEHERDARSWKAEWVAFPALCHFATAAAGMTRTLVEGLEVRPEAMAENLRRAGSPGSERLLSELSVTMGKHTAQALLHDASTEARESGRSLHAVVTEMVPLAEREALLPLLTAIDTGSAGLMVDAVLAVARERRAPTPGAER